MDQRTVLRVVYWLVFACLLLGATQPVGSYGFSKSGIFVRYSDNWTVLLLGVAAFAVMAWIGLRI